MCLFVSAVLGLRLLMQLVQPARLSWLLVLAQILVPVPVPVLRPRLVLVL